MTRTDATPPQRFTLVLEAVADPNRKHGPRYNRTPSYRLKLALKYLLRGLGLKCVSLTSAAHEQVQPGAAITTADG